MKHNSTFIHMTNQHRFWHRSRTKEQTKGRYRDDKADRSTLAVSLKR